MYSNDLTALINIEFGNFLEFQDCNFDKIVYDETSGINLKNLASLRIVRTTFQNIVLRNYN